MKKEENPLKNWLANFKGTDHFFIQLTLALTIIGLIFAVTSSTHESYRLTDNFWALGLKQIIALFIGVILLFIFWSTDYKFWHKATWPLAFISLVIMLLTVFTGLGKITGGAKRWIDIGFFQFQPAEIAKFSAILLLASFLTKYKWSDFKSSYYYLAFYFLLTLIILRQPDLGSSSILVLLFVEMLFLFEWPIWILAPSITAVLLAAYIKICHTPYQLERITYWLDPSRDPQGKGYNLIQAKYAFAFGGLWGVGLGNSIQKEGYLPVAHADFIFAIIAEEIGFLGTTAILILYSTWIIRGFYLVNKVKDKYGVILGTAIIFLISTQAVLNIAVAIGLLPVTGVTLPFFSCGGTSLIVTLAMCGILFNIVSNNKTIDN